MIVNREKKELRHKLLEHLLSLTKEEIKRRSKNVENKLSSLPVYREAKVIMGYYPLRGEVDVLGMIRKVKDLKRLCFPVMDLKLKDLGIFEITDLDKDFTLGPFGVMQPDIKKAKEVNIEEIDIAIVPGLAFDEHRNRLGRGGGFYDRFLKRLTTSTKRVGIGFEFQILKNLPTNLSQDQKVDVVVSENTII